MKQVSLARRAARLAPTMPASSHGHAIPFDSGHGFPHLFPDLTAAAEKALTTYRHETLQYGIRPGLPDLREWIEVELTLFSMKLPLTIDLEQIARL